MELKTNTAEGMWTGTETKWQKDKFQELADMQMLLPGLEYFVGRERGMHKLADYARPALRSYL